MDYPHVASIACPKPMLFTNGKKDKLFPVEGVEAAYDTMRKVWDSQEPVNTCRPNYTTCLIFAVKKYRRRFWISSIKN